MKPRIFLKQISVLALFLFVAGGSFAFGYSELPIHLSSNFEAGLQGWQIGSRIPEKPAPYPSMEGLGVPRDWSVERDPGNLTDAGQASVRMSIDGRSDDGVLWMSRYFYRKLHTEYLVDLSFQAWSSGASHNIVASVAAFAGNHNPLDVEDFDHTQALNQVKGWKDYKYRFKVTSDDRGRIWVAFGFMVNFEVLLNYGFADVKIDITR